MPHLKKKEYYFVLNLQTSAKVLENIFTSGSTQTGTDVESITSLNGLLKKYPLWNSKQTIIKNCL